MGYLEEPTSDPDPKKRNSYLGGDGRGGQGGGRNNDRKGNRKDNKPPTKSKKGKLVWSCKTEELKHDTFYCGDGMSNKFSTSRTTFLEYVNREFLDSESKSINNGLLTITEMAEPPPVNSQAELDALPFMEERTYTKDYKQYKKKKETLQKNLSKLYQNLCNACQPNLIQRSVIMLQLTWNDQTLRTVQCN